MFQCLLEKLLNIKQNFQVKNLSKSKEKIIREFGCALGKLLESHQWIWFNENDLGNFRVKGER